MKHIKLILAVTALFLASSVSAKDLTGYKIYVNPGHGGWTANDRPLATVNYAAMDTLGFYETKSNLYKGLGLHDYLVKNGATVTMSRTKNGYVTENQANATALDKTETWADENGQQQITTLSTIAQQVEEGGYDYFLSIHSNAASDGSSTNYCVLMYRGVTGEGGDYAAGSRERGLKAFPWIWNNELTNWTSSSPSDPYVVGDISWMGSTPPGSPSTNYPQYTGYLAVLKHGVPSFLSEGEFHTYQPSRQRMLNVDYCRLEGIRYSRAILDWFNADQDGNGHIQGTLKDEKNKISEPLFSYASRTDDQWMPLNGGQVDLLSEDGTFLKSYKIDNEFNGIFCFYDLAPGNYQLSLSAPGYDSGLEQVTVKANETATVKAKLIPTGWVDPNIELPIDYPYPDQSKLAEIPNHFNAEEVATAATSSFLDGLTVRRTLLRDGKYYTLALTAEKAPKLFISNPETGELIQEMSVEGIADGDVVLNDIGFTADGYLVGNNVATLAFGATSGLKVYTWEDENSAPTLLFNNGTQANWSNGIVGETAAYSGVRNGLKVYTTSRTAGGEAKNTRIVAMEYDGEGGSVSGKYMMNTGNTNFVFGDNKSFTISPINDDALIFDSDTSKPQEWVFPWNKADRSDMELKGEFADDIDLQASGVNFSRYAKGVIMSVPNCDATKGKVNVALYDVTEGLGNAKAITGNFPPEGISEDAASYMSSGVAVDGYNVNFYLNAVGEGVKKFSTVITADDAKAAVFASALKAEKGADKFTFSYTLNTEADNVSIALIGENTDEIILIDGTTAKGKNTVDVDFSKLQATTKYTWKVVANAASNIEPAKISNDEANLQFYASAGMSIDNNPNNATFGNIYVGSGAGACADRTTQTGIYAFTPDMTPIQNKEGGLVFSNGETFKGSTSSPHRLFVAPDGRLFIGDWTDGHSGVYLLDTADLNNDITQIFLGERDGNGLFSNNGVAVGGSTDGIAVIGEGENTVLFSIDEDYTADGTKAFSMLEYDLGTATTWGDAPSAIYYDNAVHGFCPGNNMTLIPDAYDGGMWVCQHRDAEDKTYPSLFHIDASGNVDFNTGADGLIGNSNRGGAALNKECNRLAIGSADNIFIFDIVRGEKLSINKIATIPSTIGQRVAALAFDYAGNLYAVSPSGNKMAIFALPKGDNTCEVDAKDAISISEIPAAPENLAYTLNNTTVSLTWDAVENASYKVYCDGVEVGTPTENSFEYDTEAEGDYTFAVSAIVNTIESDKTSIDVKVASGVEDVKVSASKVYPNPTTGAVTVSAGEAISSIKLYSVAGALVLAVEGEGNDTQVIDLSDVANGTYFLKVNNKKAVSVIKK